MGMIHTGSSSEMEMLELAKKEIEIFLRNGIYPLMEKLFWKCHDARGSEKVMISGITIPGVGFSGYFACLCLDLV